MLERLLHAAVDREGQRLAARGGIRQVFIERALHAGDAVAVDIRVAEDMRSERRLRIEPVRLALDGKAWLAERIHGLDQRGRRSATEIEEGLTGLKEREILLLALLRHQARELPCQGELVANHLVGMDRNRPG